MTLFWIYSILLLFGGVMGYIKAGSIPSLIAGISGSLLFDAIALYKARRLGQVALAAFTLFFTWRLIASGKFLPAGLMALVSLATLSLSRRRRPLCDRDQNPAK